MRMLRMLMTVLMPSTVAACMVVSSGCNSSQSAETSAPAGNESAALQDTAPTAGTRDEAITTSGCVVQVDQSYFLTSPDEAIERQEPAQSHRQDNPASPPTQANSGAQEERARMHQNVSATFGRYRLAGTAVNMSQYTNRQVDVVGRVATPGDGNDAAAKTLTVESVVATGDCGKTPDLAK